MNFRKLSGLVSGAASGKDCLPKGAVGCAGYGFVFKDFRYIRKHLDIQESGGLFHVGAIKAFVDRKMGFEEYMEHGRNTDILLAGAIKTLVPTLKFGYGYESLFNVWMFVKTPKGETFPLSFYYGQSGLVIAGCHSSVASQWSGKESEFPKKFKEIINYNPHDLSKEELEGLAEALELALQKVPLTDFYGMYKHDFGNLIMGIKDGKPLLVELGISPKFCKEESFLNHDLKLGVSQKEFKRWKLL